jgi:hypothetical protein
MRKVHELRCWPDYFAPIKSGVKTFDVRRTRDRDFQLGDTICFREWDDRTKKYSGDELHARIIYILEGVGHGAIEPLAGIMPGFAVLGIELIEQNTAAREQRVDAA